MIELITRSEGLDIVASMWKGRRREEKRYGFSGYSYM